ncbi:hypothetical protein Rsub_08307 [Raphidocelis subcapitata]|uniref:Uncharacterized protein n=1 Tax=Raphidocelis subcapitata TaxID=307507 RepID=A0A2V0P603_9CHLO|nr:hypothetical protein Rsub_08307 [Raphidocelis subcapitata]|eukprot:GBF95276.1 hypothetical protein Rsub_08307 [Raphidocelis subcapitata]
MPTPGAASAAATPAQRAAPPPPPPPLGDPCGPNVWASAAHAKDAVPEDAHEYHIRKGLRDAAFQSLQYVPVCPHVPTCSPSCAAPRWAWRPKPR